VGLASGALFLIAAWPLLRETGVLDLINHPGSLVRVGPDRAELLRWAYLTDMLGYYLLLAPMVLALRRELAPPGRRAGLELATAGGLAYVLVGATGAVTLAVVSPPLIRGAAAGDATAVMMFTTITEAVHHGLWQTLDAITGGIWLVLTGLAMRRVGTPALGVTAVVMGAASLIGSASRVLDVEPLIAVLFPLLAALPIWFFLVGLRLLRDRPFSVT
jgi:hypothetical protein